jgi:hypothetical protein
VIIEWAVHTGNLAARETIIFSQSERSRWTVQVEYRFVTVPEDMHVRGAMIIGVDTNP